MTRLGFQQLRTHLETGEPQRALEALARLGERAAVHAEYRPLEDAVKDWLLTMELSDRGGGVAGVRTPDPSTHCVGTRGGRSMRTGRPHSGKLFIAGLRCMTRGRRSTLIRWSL